MAVENYVSVLLFLFFTLAVAQGDNTEPWSVSDTTVKFWAQNIGRDMDKFTRETTGWSTLKQKYAESEFEVVDEDELVKNIGKKMKTFFSEKIDALLKLVSVAEDAYRKHVYNPSLTSYPYYNAKNLGSELVLTRDPRFQTEVNTSESAIHVPTDIYDEAPDIVNVIEWTAALDKQFIINMKNYPDLVWQYFGNVEGVLRTFPAQKWRNGPNNVDLYDCRGRAWYIQGSSSPKNIVILIDSSGSMHGMPLQIAKLAVQTLIDTLSNDDYFNVVYFKQVPKSLFCEHEAKLLQATKYNREYAKGLLHEIGATNISVWMTGLYEAFDVLKKAEVDHIGADCQQAIMIFSDGTSKDMQEVFEERNADKKVRVFTYAVGPPGNTIEPLKRMANNNKGSFATIPSIGSVRGVMVDYVTVLGRPLAIENNHSSLWTNTYLDAWGLGMMTTGTVPVFSNKTEDKKEILGVMATDVPLNQLDMFDFKPSIGPGGYMFLTDNNGMIVKHPRLKSADGYLVDQAGLDLMEAEYPLNEDLLIELRTGLINQSSGIMRFPLMDLSIDTLRVEERNMAVRYLPIEGTPFSLGVISFTTGFKLKAGQPSKSNEEALNILSMDQVYSRILNWPYLCLNTGHTEDPMKTLLENLKKKPPPSECDDNRLTNLVRDIERTTLLKTEVWDKNAEKYLSQNITSVFARTYWGLTKVSNHSVITKGNDTIPIFPSEKGFFDRVVFKSNDTITYSTTEAQSGQKQFAGYVKVASKQSGKEMPSAVLGFEMDYLMFVEKFVNSTLQCVGKMCEKNDNCDRRQKNVAEGQYCYLLDENGFLVASNIISEAKDAGRFFGEVDMRVMEQLIVGGSSSGGGIYERINLPDYQASCAAKSPTKNAGFSILQPLFSIQNYIKWWTTQAIWSLLEFNIYSWLTSSGTAADSSSKNYSCVNNMTVYTISKNASEIVKGVASSFPDVTCKRHFIATKVPQSNLHLLIVEGGCQSIDDVNIRTSDHTQMGMPGEPVESEYYQLSNGCSKEERYRRRPERCSVTKTSEAGYVEGTASLLAQPSFILLVFLLFLTCTLDKMHH